MLDKQIRYKDFTKINEVLCLCENLIAKLERKKIFENLTTPCYVAVTSNISQSLVCTISYCNNIIEAKARIANAVLGDESVFETLSDDLYNTQDSNFLTLENNDITYTIITGYKACNKFITHLINAQDDLTQDLKNKYTINICSTIAVKTCIKGEDVSFKLQNDNLTFCKNTFPDLN